MPRPAVAVLSFALLFTTSARAAAPEPLAGLPTELSAAFQHVSQVVRYEPYPGILRGARGAAALNPTFQVLDATGEVLQTGTVNASPVEVPPGEYTVKVLSTPPQVMDHVKVESAKDRVLSLPGR